MDSLILYPTSHENVERLYTDIGTLSAIIHKGFIKALSCCELTSVFSSPDARSKSQQIFLLYQKDVGLDKYEYLLCG